MYKKYIIYASIQIYIHLDTHLARDDTKYLSTYIILFKFLKSRIWQEITSYATHCNKTSIQVSIRETKLKIKRSNHVF